MTICYADYSTTAQVGPNDLGVFHFACSLCLAQNDGNKL